MKRLTVILFYIAVLHTAAAQVPSLVTPAQDARSAALGGAFLCLGGPANPAAEQQHPMLLLGVDSRFMATGMTTKRIALSYPISTTSATLAYAHFGDAAYNEQQASASMGMRIAKRWRMGARLDYAYRGYADAHYASTHRLGGAIATTASLSHLLDIGAMLAYLPLHPSPYAAAAGMAYSPLINFRLVAEVAWHAGLEYHAGAEYSYADWLHVRMGYCSSPQSLCFGLGLHFWNIDLDISSSSHPLLGHSPQISLALCW